MILPKKVIMWNITNSILAGLLVFFGAISSEIINHDVTKAPTEIITGIVLAFFTAAAIAATKFKEFWTQNEQLLEQDTSIKTNLFNFL